MIHIQRCHRWQFQSQLPSVRLNEVIYVTDGSEFQQWLWEVNNYDSERVIDATKEQRSQIVWSSEKEVLQPRRF